MSRSIILSNGELAVALDARGLVRDLYYPHVGYEDHVRGHYIHRVGVWVEGRMSWIGEDPSWQVSVECEESALASRIIASHPGIQVTLSFKDIVYNERPVFVRRVEVKNGADRAREIKLYFSHQFEIYKSHGGDTAYFDPIAHAIVHYKGQRVFLIAATLDGVSFQDFVAGLCGAQGREGSHRDADDGILSKNPIEHGQADSVIGLYASYEPGASRTCHYTLCAARTVRDAVALNRHIIEKTPAHVVRTTSDYWRAWSSGYEWNFYHLSAEEVALFRRSLFYVRAHVDNDGGILASLDSDMLQHGLDTYSYVWPRDAAYAAMALDSAGDGNVAQRFFEFCQKTVTDEGYFMQKFLPDMSLGSSWHPWIRDGKFQLPIQEDETALVLVALYQHYQHSRDLEFLEAVFSPLVDHLADFMLSYRDPETGLPRASYDLWEEWHACTTYTSSAVYGALMAAADIAKTLGKEHHEKRWREAAASIGKAILLHLWDEKRGVFYKMIRLGSDKAPDSIIDISSAYGIFAFGVLPPDDARLASAWEKSVSTLSEGIKTGGVARYQGDEYYRSRYSGSLPGSEQWSVPPGNPWIVTTLWHAEYLIARAKTDKDLDAVRDIFTWVVKRALPSGVLPEQFDALSGEALSATPLMWSHAAYISAVFKYLDRLGELGIARGCNPVP